MRIAALYFSVFLFLHSCNTKEHSHDNDSDKIQLTKVCDQIMSYFSDGNYPGAMKLLKQSSLLGNNSIDTLELTIKQQMNKLDYRYGKVISFRFVEDRAIQELLTKRTYLLFFEGNYLKFDFTLYKSKFGWKITTFEYSPEIDNLFKQRTAPNIGLPKAYACWPRS